MNVTEILAMSFAGGAVACYLAAGSLFCAKKSRLAYIAAIVGWCFNVGIFIQNWYINGYPPFASMYQVLGDISLLFVLLMVFIRLRYAEHGQLAPYFFFGAAIPLIGTLFMDRNMHWSLMPALRSPYFVPHVCSYVLSYALCAVAFLIGVVGFFRKDRSVRRERAMYLILRIAFPFMVSGLLLGALWAD